MTYVFIVVLGEIVCCLLFLVGRAIAIAILGVDVAGCMLGVEFLLDGHGVVVLPPKMGILLKMTVKEQKVKRD